MGYWLQYRHIHQIAAQTAGVVVTMDGDPDAIEQFYLAQRTAGGGRILPLVANLANPSPGQGWDGRERKALHDRGKPDPVLCLSVIHHMRVSASIHLPMFMSWLRSLGAEVVIEFVDRHDEKFVKLLTNRTIAYGDNTLEAFEAAL